MHSITTNSTHVLWNGPVCPTCGARCTGRHTCSPTDLARKIRELTDLLDGLSTEPADPTRGCPCRPENGGSGVCGCVLGSWRITCR